MSNVTEIGYFVENAGYSVSDYVARNLAYTICEETAGGGNHTYRISNISVLMWLKALLIKKYMHLDEKILLYIISNHDIKGPYSVADFPIGLPITMVFH